MNKRASILLSLFIVGLIFFDAAQQKYYMETFDLSPSGNISFIELLSNHLIRWSLWSIVTIPFGLFVWRKYLKTSKPSSKGWALIGLLIGVSTVLSLAFISFHSLVSQDADMGEFSSFFLFFVFQKGLIFMMATGMLMLLLFNHSKIRMISEQSVEIKNLKRTTSNLQDALNKEETPHLNVKTGYKLKPVPLEDVIWIQSDDYCVKIHTQEKTFTLRQSLKTLENKLAPFRFIRIHRTALLNLDYIDQINFETAKVRLLNETELPYSKTGIKCLKERMKDIAS